LKNSREKTPEKQGIAFESLKGEKTPEKQEIAFKKTQGRTS